MNKQSKETKAGHAAEQHDDLIMLRGWLLLSHLAAQPKRMLPIISVSISVLRHICVALICVFPGKLLSLVPA